MQDTPPTDPRRRRLLMRLGLAAGLAYAAPAMTGLGRARASGPDGDGGDWGGAGDGGGGADGRRWSRPSRPSRPRPQVRRAPPPEIVALLPQGQSSAPIEAAGYAILASASVQALAATLLRLALPAGRTTDQARAEIEALVPGALSDINHLYAPDAFLCDQGSCAAQDAIGWSSVSARAAPRRGSG